MRYPFRTPNRRTDIYGDLWIDGSPYMGRVRVPPMPPRIALTDRTDGSVKVLSDNGTSIVLVTPTTSMRDVVIYGPFEGPYSGAFRLYLDSGSIAFEPVLDGIIYNSARILSRNGYNTTVVEITANPDGSMVQSLVTL